MRALVLVALLLGRLSVAADDAPLKCYTPVEIQRIADTKAASDALAANDAARIRLLEADAGKVPVVPLMVTGGVALVIGIVLGVVGVKVTEKK